MCVSYDLPIQHVAEYVAVRKPQRDYQTMFHVNNQVSIKALPPLVQDEIEQGVRENYVAQTIPIGRIPHMRFGSKGKVYFYIFFPRLLRKRADGANTYDTSVPDDVQDTFYDLFNWCIRRVMKGSGKESYFLLSVQGLLEQNGGRRGFVPDYKLDSDTITKVLDLMREIVHKARVEETEVSEDDPDEEWVANGALPIIKNFFFVCDVRGIKLETMAAMQPDTVADLTVRLMQELSVFDFRKLSNSKLCSVYVDLAICFTPQVQRRDDTGQFVDVPCVGLWNMDNIADSLFASGGVGIEKHPMANLPHHGNISCSMGEDARRHTGIYKWIFYTLYYQMFRGRNSKIAFPPLQDALAGNSRYIRLINHLINLFEEGRDSNVGVRLEVRVGFHTLLELLKKNKIVSWVCVLRTFHHLLSNSHRFCAIGTGSIGSRSQSHTVAEVRHILRDLRAQSQTNFIRAAQAQCTYHSAQEHCNMHTALMYLLQSLITTSDLPRRYKALRDAFGELWIHNHQLLANMLCIANLNVKGIIQS